jgi:sodium transport system permease protein
MTFLERVHTIYRKELKDILRDRRTLIAMIVVPIVLYPLLMVGSIQAVSFQSETLHQERVILGVISEKHGYSLNRLIELDAAALAARQRKQKPTMGEPETKDAEPEPVPLTGAEIRIYASEEAISQAIHRRRIQAGVVFGEDEVVSDWNRQNQIRLHVDQEEVRSAAAGRRIREMLDRITAQTRRNRLIEVGLPPTFVDPFSLRVINLASPPSILGQVLPLVLVLMTITGAIYPAIDLTAGERERGTLESVMVCPVPVFDLIVGKFLVVTTIAILGAALNLASVSATVDFGGFQQLMATTGGGVPIAKMLFVLLALIPFAVLMSAIMIAVCSFARTFKEAQNYVTPVIIAVLIPGGFAAFPATRLEGINLVMPVGNMVLLAREVLLGASVPGWQIAIVLLSTTLYAAAAVAIAANLFGQEAVLFSDVGSLKTTLSRRYIRPREKPTLSTALLIVALLFPAWFFVQASVSPREGGDTGVLLRATAILMPLMFVAVPAGVLAYARTNLRNAFALRSTPPRFVLAALILGVSAWIPLHELTLFQMRLIPIPPPVAEELTRLETAIAELGPAAGFVFIALVPAVSEEFLFRGLLLGALSNSTRRWAAILASAIVFGVFHFVAFRFVPTFALGLVLGVLCLQSRSLVPCVLFHFLHNGQAVATLHWPWRTWIGIPADQTAGHLPPMVLVIGGAAFLLGLFLACEPFRDRKEKSLTTEI